MFLPKTSNLMVSFKHYKVTLIFPLCQLENKKIWLILCHPCSQFTYYFSSHTSLLVQLVTTQFIASLSFLNFTPCCMVPFLISTTSCLWDSCSNCAFITLLSQSWLLALVQIWSVFSCSIGRPKFNWTPPTTNNNNTSPENLACLPTTYMSDISNECFHIFFHFIFPIHHIVANVTNESYTSQWYPYVIFCMNVLWHRGLMAGQWPAVFVCQHG